MIGTTVRVLIIEYSTSNQWYELKALKFQRCKKNKLIAYNK